MARQALRLLTLLVFLLILPIVFAAPGTIQMTDENGQPTNNYGTVCAPYVTGSGLTDGEYFYQVTSPGGDELFAGPFAIEVPDTSTKTISVVNGEFGPMEVCPYDGQRDQTYKVWVTPIPDFQLQTFGFVIQKSKVATFRIDTPPGCIPEPEVCDGVDNDCNGFVDDNLGTINCGCEIFIPACVDGVPQSCTSSFTPESFELACSSYQIPEFSTIALMVAVIGGLAGIVVIRRK